ncbi:S8 family serine peptidase [Streptomyces sp. NPDC002309]
MTVTPTGDGQTSTEVVGAQGGPSGAHVMTVGTDTYVYPDAALPYIASGALDEGLFNVTSLLEFGYDDSRSDATPLIVTYTDEAARARTQPTPRGASRTLTLNSIQGAAISARHTGAAGFWSSLTGTSSQAGGASTSGRTASHGRLAGGIAKVWLDGKVTATLADSTAQIGAPEVWKGGESGQGVDVAVLDSGIDAEHPDFAGQLSATKSFVPDEDASDSHGHGTHVASTVAGTGAASEGKERGVAPGASLHIGKVLDKDGTGQNSWVLAGMEWAAREQHAKIVSMSLGGEPTDGSDPLSQAVNRLSEETGALFVVAAGNSGPRDFTVGAPGAADAALTVGAVDGADRLAPFSSRGPRVGDNALKPDLTAPGVDILAARSQYAEGGEGAYQTMSGTSMATPHVAGAAALLAARHPEWTGRQLKDALVSTTKVTQRYSPFSGGSGRLDIAATVNAGLLATGSVFARPEAPFQPGQTVRKDVTYTNIGETPVTVDLAVSAPGVPEGLFTLSDSTVTVPAHGTATVGLVIHLDAAVDDAGYSGVVTATGRDGVLRTHTPVGVSKRGPRANLSVTSKDRRGAPLPGTVIVKELSRSTAPAVFELDATGRMSADLHTGTYAAWMYADVPGIDTAHTLGKAVFNAPEIVLDRDRTVRFDAAQLRKVAAVTPQRTVNRYLRIDQYRSYEDLYPYYERYELPARYDGLWVTPTPKVEQGTYKVTTRWRQIQPALTLSAGGSRFDGFAFQSLSPRLPRATGTESIVWAGNGTPGDFARAAARGKIAVVRRSDTVSGPAQADAAARAGARLLLILDDGHGRLDLWADEPKGAPLPVASLGTDDAARLLPLVTRRGARVQVISRPHTEYLYDLARRHEGAVPGDPSYRPKVHDLARIDETFRHTEPGEATTTRTDLWAGDPQVSATDFTVVDAQGATTSWVTVAPGLKWVSQVGVPGLYQMSPAASFRPGKSVEETWFAPVHHPRFVSEGFSTAPARFGNFITLPSLYAWGDSGGHTGFAPGDDGVTEQVSLHQGDQVLVEPTNRFEVEVPEDPGTYRLVMDTSRNTSGRPYSTRTHTEWTFASRLHDHATGTPLALVQLDYGVPTDLSGKAHRRSAVTVGASHMPGVLDGAPMKAVTLEVSYDDGATWHRTSVRHTEAGWQGKLDAPSRARYASLRTSATDQRGNNVSQTIIRAFGLR